MSPRPMQPEDLYRIPFVSDPQLSPDGSRVAFVVTRADREQDADRSQVWLVGADGGTPAPFTRGRRDVSPRWSPDGQRLAFVSARDGDGPPQLWVIPAGGGEASQLTSLAGGASNPAWSPQGDRIAFLSLVDLEGEHEGTGRAAAPVVTRRLGYKADGAGLLGSRRQHLFCVGAAGGDPLPLTDGDQWVSAFAWSPEGDRIAFVAGASADRDRTFTSEVRVVAAGGGQAATLAEGLWSTVAWNPEGSALLLCGREGVEPGHAKLYLLAAAGGRPQELAPGFDRNVMPGAPGYPGAPPRFTPDGQWVLFCARDRGCVRVYRTPAAPGGTPEVIVGGERVVGGLSADRAGARLAFVAATPASPGEVFVCDREGAGEVQLTFLAAEALGDVEVFSPEPRTFRAPDGTELHGWLLRGRTEGPGPLLLDVHGGPHNAWGPVFDGFRLYHQTLAARGWTVLLLNSRGSDGYGEAFWTAVVGGWGEADEADFLAAVDQLVAEGVADPDRLAVTGYSYGGYMTNWLTARSRRFGAAVTGGCVSDLVSMVGTSDLGLQLARLELGGGVPEALERLLRLSPIAYAGGVRAPTLILHGEQDERCPVGQAEEWFAALRALGVEVELVRYPGAGHLFVLEGRPSHRVDYCARVVAWVTERLGRGMGEPAAARAAGVSGP